MIYVVDIMAIRRSVHESCRRLITDKRMAEALYDFIIMPLEDEIVDELVQCKDCKWWHEDIRDYYETDDGIEIQGLCEAHSKRDTNTYSPPGWFCGRGEKK